MVLVVLVIHKNFAAVHVYLVDLKESYISTGTANHSDCA